MPCQEPDSRYYKLLSDQKVHITPYILRVRRTSHKRCPKSYVALFGLKTRLRRSSTHVNFRHYPTPVTIKPQSFHKLIGPL